MNYVFTLCISYLLLGLLAFFIHKFKKNHYYLGYQVGDKKKEIKPLPDYFMIGKVKRGS